MRTLYHQTICPFSRTIRMLLHEKKLDFIAELEPFWQKRSEFLYLNPAGQIPVLADINGEIIPNTILICMYLEQVYNQHIFTPPELKMEAWRLLLFFSDKFAYQVSLPLIMEKYFKRYWRAFPDSQAIRNAKANLKSHMEYINLLCDDRKWLAGNKFTIADIATSTHLSVVDYFGDVPWDEYPAAKEWYMKIKSRPSFRQFLSDRLPGVVPATDYDNLDF